MNCIATHQSLHSSLQNTAISLHDTITHNKILSRKATNAPLSDLMLLPNNKMLSPTHEEPVNSQKLSKSVADLDLQVRDVQASCGTSVSMSKLHHALNSGNRVPAMSRLMHNAVFTTAHARGTPIRRRPQALKVHKFTHADRRRTKELKLDDMGSLRLRMEEYRKLRKAGKHSEDFSSTESDDEDLE